MLPRAARFALGGHMRALSRDGRDAGLFLNQNRLVLSKQSPQFAFLGETRGGSLVQSFVMPVMDKQPAHYANLQSVLPHPPDLSVLELGDLACRYLHLHRHQPTTERGQHLTEQTFWASHERRVWCPPFRLPCRQAR